MMSGAPCGLRREAECGSRQKRHKPIRTEGDMQSQGNNEEAKTNQSERMWWKFEERNEWDGTQRGLWLAAKGKGMKKEFCMKREKQIRVKGCGICLRTGMNGMVSRAAYGWALKGKGKKGRKRIRTEGVMQSQRNEEPKNESE